MKAPLLPKEGSWVWSLIWVTACSGAAGASPQLIHARRAYERAQQTPTSHYALDALFEARDSLHAAEVAHEREPNSYAELSLAYVAERRAQLATVKGNLTYALALERNAEKALFQHQAKLLENARCDAHVLRRHSNDEAQALEHATTRIDEERETHDHAQGSAGYEQLKDVARVHTGEGTTIIELDSSVMFATGEASLLPYARATLDRVARSIVQVSPGARLRVVGHTDDQGSAETNRQLSLVRAQSVATYLIAKGIEQTRVVATGMGEEQPQTSNQTVVGRAHNRRVDLIVEPAEPMLQNRPDEPDQVVAPDEPVAPGDETPIPLGADSPVPVPSTSSNPAGASRTPDGVRPSRGTMH